MSEPPNAVLIRHLTLKNFLSFGLDNAGIELKALKLFIGPNGCVISARTEHLRTTDININASRWGRHFQPSSSIRRIECDPEGKLGSHRVGDIESE
jgi:hypothetical protein